jgi:hypothetical protein
VAEFVGAGRFLCGFFVCWDHGKLRAFFVVAHVVRIFGSQQSLYVRLRIGDLFCCPVRASLPALLGFHREEHDLARLWPGLNVAGMFFLVLFPDFVDNSIYRL